MASHTGRKLTAVACTLIFVNGVMAQDAFEARSKSAEGAPGYLKVEISNNIVTLQANHVGVQDVLDELARQSDLLVISHGPLHGRLSLELERLPLSEALRRIMQGRSYLLHQARPATGTMTGGDARQNSLWIFTDGSGDEPGHDQPTGRYSLDIAAVIAELQLQLMSDDVRLRQAAIKDLRRLKVNQVIGPLSYALADEDSTIRVKAIYALADIGGDGAIAAMAAAAADENSWVRAETAYALGTLGGSTAIQILKHALHDNDSDVREAAIEAFTDIGGGQSAGALAAALQDADASLRVEAVYALADIGGDAAMRHLYQAKDNRDSAVRTAANEALAELSGEDP